MNTFIIFSIRDVLHIRLDMDNIIIAFWLAMLFFAASSPARRTRLAQRTNQRSHSLDFHNMAWIEVLTLFLLLCAGLYILYSCLTANTERVRRRRRLDAIRAQFDEMTRRHREAAEHDARDEAPVLRNH